MHRSYVSKAWIDAFINNDKEILPSEAEVRFFSVLRVKPDEEVAVFDGDGREVVGTLKKHAKGAHFAAARLSKKSKALPEIVVVQGAIDEAKLSQTIQRGTEFGVDRFIIFSASRGDSFCFAKIEKRHSRLVRIAEDAARQSGRYFVPTIQLVKNLDDILNAVRNDIGLAIFGDVRSNEILSAHLQQRGKSDLPTYLAIGPEGGFSQDEMVKLKASGFIGVMWAPYVLRAEVALLAPVAILNAFFGRA